MNDIHLCSLLSFYYHWNVCICTNSVAFRNNIGHGRRMGASFFYNFFHLWVFVYIYICVMCVHERHLTNARACRDLTNAHTTSAYCVYPSDEYNSFFLFCCLLSAASEMRFRHCTPRSRASRSKTLKNAKRYFVWIKWVIWAWAVGQQ